MNGWRCEEVQSWPIRNNSMVMNMTVTIAVPKTSIPGGIDSVSGP